MTTFGIGGIADYFLLAENPVDLIAGIEWAKNKRVPVKVFGGGSNSFFADGNHHCLVIRSLGGKTFIKGEILVAQSGTVLALVVKKANASGLAGLERMAGIPGTIGGAVVGNSGAYGTCIADVVSQVEIWDGTTRRWLSKAECMFDYRQSIFKNKPWYVLKIELKLSKADPKKLQAISDECDQTRGRRYPEGIKTPGCYFKNTLVEDLTEDQLKQIPQEIIKGGKIPTGWLIEQTGLKGTKVGDAQMAEFHANFMLNIGNATAGDVLELTRVVQDKVEEKFGFRPQPETNYL